MASASRIFFITGANSGVGYSTTKAIGSASSDYHVIMACRTASKAQKAMDEIKASGIKGTISVLEMDVADEKSIAAGAKKVEEQFGHVDVVINNAGIAREPFEITQELMQQMFLTNVTGSYLVLQYFERLLEKSKNAYLVNISSGLGSCSKASEPDAYQAVAWDPYRVTKAALNMLTLVAHKRFSKKGIKVFAFCPGLVKSNLRGTSEEQVSAGGHAGDPMLPAQALVDLSEGKRDQDVGKFLHKDGIYDW